MTEVYISDDGAHYNKLDLDKDEQIIMQYIAKDLKDLSKVFAPFSKEFPFKATTKNQKSLMFFGDTNLQRPYTGNKYFTKIYTNGIINLTGKIQVKKAKYENGTLKTYSASFGTFMTSLKDVIGSDTLNDIGSCLVDIPASDLSGLMSTAKTSPDGKCKYFVPFMSNNRVWFLDEADDETQDNIWWKSSTTFNSDKFINGRELRPALSVISILNLIKAKYQLDITAPIESRTELSHAYILCNNSQMKNVGLWPLAFPSNSVNQTGPDGKYSIIGSDGFLRLNIDPTKYSHKNYVNFKMKIKNKFNDLIPDSVGRVKIFKNGTDIVLFEEEFTTKNGSIVLDAILKDSMFTSNELDIYIKMSWDDYVVHTESMYSIQYRSKQFATFPGEQITTTYIGSYNYSGNSYTSYKKKRIDLLQALPSTPIIEFIESYLKTFNLNIFDTSPNDNRLFWLTPADINTIGLEYSKATVDYTPYLDNKAYDKESLTAYNQYNFKHKLSGYKSNVDFLKGSGIEYGQVLYPSVPPSNPVPYKVETGFSIIPPVVVAGTDNVLTTYGFTADEPELTDDDHFRYTPNYDELTIFYKQSPFTSPEFFSVISNDSAGTPTIAKVSTYCPALPFNQVGNSLAFSVVVVSNTSFPDSLYVRGYKSEIERLLNQNTLKHSYKLKLPFSEIYLNESTTIQGAGDTPSGFRLQNDIIIGETKYSIIDASIDITTGDTSMTLLNY